MEILMGARWQTFNIKMQRKVFDPLLLRTATDQDFFIRIHSTDVSMCDFVENSADSGLIDPQTTQTHGERRHESQRRKDSLQRPCSGYLSGIVADNGK